MMKKIAIGCWAILFVLTGCSTEPQQTQAARSNNEPYSAEHPYQAEQYIDGKLTQELTSSKPKLPVPVNIADYRQQIEIIKRVSPSLYQRNKTIYDAIEQWIAKGLRTPQFNQVNLQSYQLAGKDYFGNVLLTGYYTPVLKARHRPDPMYRFPLYGMPPGNMGRLPSRAEIYDGALSGRNLELAYTASIMDNFLMEVQGSGYVDFQDGTPLVFFGYKGKNGRSYTSIGRLLVEQNEIEKESMSMQSIRNWASKQSEDRVRTLLNQNASFVFFHPKDDAPVIGSAGIPLIAKASVASDLSVIPSGTVLLVEVPLLDSEGRFNGKRETRLMVALDRGGAIKGHHFDVYQGIGDEAGALAGFYNHYGRVWVIK